MNKKHLLRLLALFFASSLVLAGCKPENVTVNIDATKLVGTWYALDKPQEFWRFDSGNNGETWDESEDVHEGEGVNFNWLATKDQLQLDFYGQMGQHVYFDYTFTAQNDTSFTL